MGMITKTKVHIDDWNVETDNKKIVKATLTWSPIYEPELDNLAAHFIPCTQTSTGVAYCSPEDTFDLEKGKKIALARAEAAAYNQMTEYIRGIRENLLALVEETDRFMNLSIRVRRGNKTFVKMLDNGEI